MQYFIWLAQSFEETLVPKWLAGQRSSSMLRQTLTWSGSASSVSCSSAPSSSITSWWAASMTRPQDPKPFLTAFYEISSGSPDLGALHSVSLTLSPGLHSWGTFAAVIPHCWSFPASSTSMLLSQSVFKWEPFASSAYFVFSVLLLWRRLWGKT